MVSCIFSNCKCVIYIIRVLTYYASKAKDKVAYKFMRQWFMFWGPPMIIISLFVFLSLRIQNSNHFYNAITHYWWMFLQLVLFSS